MTYEPYELLLGVCPEKPGLPVPESQGLLKGYKLYAKGGHRGISSLCREILMAL